LHDPAFSHFGRSPLVTDGQTDGQTDTRRQHIPCQHGTAPPHCKNGNVIFNLPGSLF